MEKIVRMSVTKHKDPVVGVVLKVGAAIKISNTMDAVVLLRLKTIMFVWTKVWI